MRIFHLPLGSIFVAVVITTLASADEARFAKWAKVEFSFRGPAAQGRGEPNPFAVKLDVDFCAPGGRHYRVPGFYDGDGRGGLDGDVWKVRFSADEIGSWTYTTISDNQQLHGKTGRFAVSDVPANEVVRAGKAFCLAKHGESYALYLPEGGEVEVQLPAGRDFVVTWWNPAQGRACNFTHESRVRGDRQKLVAPGDGDRAARIVLVQQPQARRQP